MVTPPDFIPTDLVPWLIPNFSMFQLLGMAFVLGNFFTATADDLDHMSSTRGFLKTWSIIVAVILCLDIGDLLYNGYEFFTELVPLIIKWVMLAILCALCHQRVGVVFRLATGDVVAIASAGALLSPILIIIFFIILKVIDLIEKPILSKFGDGEAYPFMPVIFTSYAIMLLIGLVLGGYLF